MNITASAHWTVWKCWMCLLMISTHYLSGYVSLHLSRSCLCGIVASLSCLTGESVYQCDDYMLLILHDSHELNSSAVVLWVRITHTIIIIKKDHKSFYIKYDFLYINACNLNGFWRVSLVCILLYISPWRWFHLDHSKAVLMKDPPTY